MPEGSENRILFLLKSKGAQTAAALGEALGMTSVGARQHLLRLQEQGLVKTEDRRHTVGRPKRFWALTGAGHRRFPDTHSQLTLELVDSVRAVFGEEGLDHLIYHREELSCQHYAKCVARCESLESKVRKIAELRAREGYMAECCDNADGSFLLIENHCPICAAASSCQRLCRSELEVFRRALGPGVKVERIEHLLAGARRCAYRIAPQPG
jgi:predicted ArsR family transcriptional regulator